MRAVYLVTLHCWAALWNDSIIGIGAGNRYFFDSRDDLVAELHRCGLDLRNQQVVVKTA